MKLTIISNYGHGAYLSGDRLLSRQGHFKNWLAKQDSQYFDMVAEEVMLDRDEVGVDGESAALNMTDFLSAKSIKTRGGFVICQNQNTEAESFGFRGLDFVQPQYFKPASFIIKVF